MKPRLIAVTVALLGLIGALHWMARFDLRGPDSLGKDDLALWFDDPTRAAATALRWLALMLSYYLLWVFLIVGLSDVQANPGRLRRLVPSGLAGWVGALIGTSAVLIPMASHMTNGTPAASIVAEQPLRLAPVEAPLRLVEIDNATKNQATDLPPLDGRSGSDQQSTAVFDTWPVKHGDHLWSISAETLVDHWQRHDLSDGEIADYWRTVIEANQDRMVEPGNPDLIVPGQQILLPTPPKDPRS